MPTYFYSAKTEGGEYETGTLFAKDTHDLSAYLKSKGMLLIRAVIEEEKQKRFFDFLTARPQRISLSDKLMITRNLQIMVSTGLSLTKSFYLLASQARDRGVKKALLSIQGEISKGESLAKALEKYPGLFSEIFRNMVAVGESSGTLEESMKILSLQIEKEHRLKAKIKRAIIYPSILLSVMILAGGVVMTVFVPGLKKLFEGMHVELPFYTKAIITAGEFMLNYWYFIIIIIVLSVPILLNLVKTRVGKRLKDTVLINLPVFSRLVKKANTASLVRSLSSLISSGVALTESLEITSRTLSNIYFKEALLEAAQRIRKGESFFSALKPYKNIFPFGAIETIEVGEETGETTTILKKLADFYEEEVMDAADNISVLIEPILIVVLGVAVGVFAFAIISPLYSVLGMIG